MRRLSIVVTASLTFAAVLSTVGLVRGDFPDMMKRVPGDANVLVMMDLDRIIVSALANKEGWKEKRAADYASRPLTFPPQVTRLVRAAHVDLELQEAKWHVALLEAARVPPLGTIAKNMQGYVDTVANTSVVWSPRGWYGFKVGERGFGVMFPANRQYLSRWIKEPSGRLSPYLMKASGEMTASGAQVIVALDLEDVVKPQQLEERLKEKDSLKDVKNVGEIAKTIATIQGLQFAVSISDKATGTLTVDFGGDAAALKEVAKPLLLEALGDNGLHLVELEGWTASVDKKAVTLKGDLTRSGLMRLSSLLELPSPPLDESGRDVDAADAGDPKLYATQNYFKSIQTLLDDLLTKKKEATSFGQLAKWVDQYATRIDRLPLANVDEDMQKYSLTVVDLMRQGSTALKGVGIRTGARTSQVWSSGYDYYGYRTGYGSSYETSQQRRAIKAQEQASGATAGRELAEKIAQETAKIRRLMSDRYKVNF